MSPKAFLLLFLDDNFLCFPVENLRLLGVLSVPNCSVAALIFLLDDIFSYLDNNFINLVLEKLNELKVQTWMTDVKGDWIFEDKSYKAIIDKINIDDKRFKVN